MPAPSPDDGGAAFAFERQVAGAGGRSIVLVVLAANLAARRVYARHGMAPVWAGEDPLCMQYAKLLDAG